MPIDALRAKLSELLAVLRTNGNQDDRYDRFCTDQVARALAGDDRSLREYLISNDLWGGAGSIADQALVGTAASREGRKKAEAILADLGEMQMAAGLLNVRTEMWTSAFRKWQRGGI